MGKNNGHLSKNARRIDKLLSDGKKIDIAMKRAARKAVREHQLAGNPVAVERNGAVAWIKPHAVGATAKNRRRVAAASGSHQPV
jgi:isoaspartyl peptidase/L-asparaginase-like protein (Ntn-hydrolase superfamily)